MAILAALMVYLGAGGFLSLVTIYPARHASAVAYSLGFLGSALQVAAGVALWQSRRVAVPLVVASLPVAFVALVEHLAVDESWRERQLTPRGLLGLAIGYGLHVAVVIYLVKLRRKGVLAT